MQNLQTVKAVAERLGWCVMVGDSNIYFETTSPGGEDFGFEIQTTSEIPSEIRSFANNFDAQSHANKWALAEQGSDSQFGTVEDALEIKEKLLSLAAEMGKN